MDKVTRLPAPGRGPKCAGVRHRERLHAEAVGARRRSRGPGAAGPGPQRARRATWRRAGRPEQGPWATTARASRVGLASGVGENRELPQDSGLVTITQGGFHPSPDLGGGRRIRPISCTYKPRPRRKVSALHSVLPLAPRWPLGAPVSGAAEGNVARAPGSKQRGWPRSKETGNKCGDYHSTLRVRSIHPCAHTGPCTQAGLTGLCAVLPGIRSALTIYSQRDQMRGGLCAHFPSVHASSF